MAFESGSLAFRAFYMGQSLPDDHIDRFARDALPPLDTVGREAALGWVTGRHLLDRAIRDETAYFGAYLRLALVRAERRIPTALLRAECKMEELALLEAAGGEYVKREERTRIRKEVEERLQPQMPPQLTAIPFVCGREGDRLFASAMSDKQLEVFLYHFEASTGVSLTPVTPESAALKRKQFAVHQLGPCSLSPECNDEMVAVSPGLDFLTWLWFFSEERGGVISTQGGEFAVALEGPLTFIKEGQGAHEARLRKGDPLGSMEAKTALLSGKKLSKARVTVARDHEQWSAEIDAETFGFRGVKLPKGEMLDPVSRFQDRLLSLQTFLSAWLSFYDRFIDERRDGAEWNRTRDAIHAWVRARSAAG